MASEPTLSSLAALAASSSGVDDDAYSADPSSSRGAPKTKEQLRRHYIRALHKVIDEADIIILVLDARDPEGCRSRLVEEEVRRRESEGKRLVFVLNKVGECLPSVLGAVPLSRASGAPAHPFSPRQERCQLHRQTTNVTSRCACTTLGLTGLCSFSPLLYHARHSRERIKTSATIFGD